MKLCLTKEMAKMTLDLKEEITKMWLDMGDQFQHLIASINRLKEGFRSLREELNTCQRDHNFEKTKSKSQKALKNQSIMKTTKPTTGLVKNPQRYYLGVVIVLEMTRRIEKSIGGDDKPYRLCSRTASIHEILTFQKCKGLVIRKSSFQRLVHERGGQHLLHETHMKEKELQVDERDLADHESASTLFSIVEP